MTDEPRVTYRVQRQFGRARNEVQRLESTIEYQQENIDPAFRDRRPSQQPPASDGNRNHQISPDGMARIPSDLFVALDHDTPKRSMPKQDEKVELLLRCVELQGECRSLPRTKALEEKSEMAESFRKLVEDVAEFMTIEDPWTVWK